MKKFIAAVSVSVAMVVSAGVNADTLSIVWSGSGGSNIYQTITINPNNTFVAGPYSGTWSTNSNNSVIYLTQTSGPSCSAQYSNYHFSLVGSLLNASPAIYGGSASCYNPIFSGLITYSGSWTYQ